MSSVYPAATPYISGTYGNGPNGSDTLTVRYQGSGDGAGNPDGSVVDCLNVPVDSNTTVTNIFSLNTSNQLQCQALNANAPTPNDTQVLISGVENFHVLFGEDITGDASADRFVNANYAFLTWSNMVSVRLSLLFRSDNQVGPFTQQPTFYMLGTSYTPASADNFLRNQLNFTVVLRNLV
jgi:type IV pilus assembly protein PilW